MEQFTVNFIDKTQDFKLGNSTDGVDMTKSVYDPTNKSANAFDYANFSGVADVLSLNTEASESVAQGQFAWNADEETFDFGLNGAVLQGGQEIHYHVRNNSGTLISNGVAVMASGTIGSSGRITIAKMDGSSIANAKFFLGITTEDIADGTDGKVTFFGKVRGIDTSSFNEGDVLWVDNAVLGGLTSTMPTINTRLPIAFVVTSHANQGTIAVRSTDGTYLNESHDTNIVNPINGNSLVHDGTKWVNQTLTTITETSNTNTIINLSNVIVNLCNMASANPTTTYTLTEIIAGGNARVLINAASEPIITGATRITGSDFIISTDMYLVVFNNGNVTQFRFEKI